VADQSAELALGVSEVTVVVNQGPVLVLRLAYFLRS